MKIERTKNATRNIVFVGTLKIFQLLVPFLMRTIMLRVMGVQYLGLNGLFYSILEVLNLAELGVGSAMVYSMYKPIAEDDKVTICALMRLYKVYYRIIGLIIAVIGMALTPVIPHLIKDSVPPDINIYILYWMNLGITVLSYWLFAYKNSLFTAYQREDIVSKVRLATLIVQYSVQVVILVAFHNYYLYVIVALLSQALNNIITAIVVTHYYPDYSAKGIIDKKTKSEINARIRDLFTSKLGGVIVNQADTIVISAFLGLEILAVYQNYYYFFSAVAGMIAVVYTASLSGIGNSIIVDTKEKVYGDFKTFSFIIAWIAGFCCCCFICLYQPTIELWVGKKLMLDFGVVICIVFYFFVYEINTLLNVYKDASGTWHKDRFRTIVTALTNLLLNLLMVNYIGLYGIVLSTVLSILFVGMPWLFQNLFTEVFERKYVFSYIRKLLIYVLTSVIVVFVTYFVASKVVVSLLGTILIRLCICIVLPNILFFIVYRNMPEYNKAIDFIIKATHNKIPFLGKLKRKRWD